MNGKIKVILNPYSNRWNALKRKGELESALKQAGLEYDLQITEFPRHGTELAKRAASDGYRTIISAGGDGSFHEVVNGIMQASSDEYELPNFGIMPLGTANDLAVNLKLPLDLLAAAKIIAQNSFTWMDLGRVTYHVDGTERTVFFGNNSAIGLEPTITLIQQQIKFIKGTPRYIVSALAGIMRNPQWTMHIKWDGGEYHGKATLVTIGNHPLTGGVFYMTPHADGFDGLLTFVFGAISSRRRILKIFPDTMKIGPGSYVERPEISEIHSPWVKIVTDQPTPLHTDGEIQSKSIHEMEYHIMPKALPVLIG
jgi:diacylglycerol kinase (ATP)